jgi:hypothetical protein
MVPPTRASEATWEQKLMDRHGGLIISIFIHLAVASYLWLWPVSAQIIESLNEPKTLRITFQQPSAESFPLPPPPAEQPPMDQADPQQETPQEQQQWDEAASVSTIVQPDQDSEEPQIPLPVNQTTAAEMVSPELVLEAVQQMIDEETAATETPSENPEPVEQQEPEPTEVAEQPDEGDQPQEPVEVTEVSPREYTDEELAFLEAEKEAARKALADLKAKNAEQSNNVQALLMTTAARQSFYTAAGSSTGVVRTFDLRMDLDKGIIRRVLHRNGIEIMQKYVDESTHMSSPITGVVTEDSTFTNQKKIRPGTYEVFEISERALRKLAELEIAWIRKNGYEPEEILLEQVVYGIKRVGYTGYWDLAILEIKIAN